MSQVSKEIPFKSMSESFTALQDKGMYYVDKTGFIPYLIPASSRVRVDSAKP